MQEHLTMTSFTKEADTQFGKRPLKINGRVANRKLTSLVEEATVRPFPNG